MSVNDEGKSTSLARNRDNQRRARERRQTYIKELEQRTRDYEAAGVQATVEIQNAAKRVVDENARLRALLHHMGVDSNQVDDYLQYGQLPEGQVGNADRGLPGATLLNPTTETRNDRLEASKQLVQMSMAPARGQYQGYHAAPPQDLSLSPPMDDYESDRPDETSCIDAAQIIAGMRGLTDSREIWPELGCSEDKPCRVKNVKLFQMMDR